jgi:arylsulfatase A-like enzyme
MAALREAGLEHPTLVVLTSDHGEEFWEHDNVMHGHTLYGELLEIPLLFTGIPGLRPGERDNGPCSLVDIVPTVMDALGLQRPLDLSGRSLVQTVEATDTPQYGEALQFYRELKSIARDGWKLIQSPEYGPVSLFRLETDPGEEVNEKDRFPGIVESLSATLDSHLLACQEQADRLNIRHEASTISLTPKLREELRAEGYIE